jgi:staphylococcal nuclease domain-containing protein 1
VIIHSVDVLIQSCSLQSPAFKLDSENKPDPKATEPLAEEAKYFTESRLLQREVQVILESSNNNNFVGTVIHPVRSSSPPILFDIVLNVLILFSERQYC